MALILNDKLRIITCLSQSHPLPHPQVILLAIDEHASVRFKLWCPNLEYWLTLEISPESFNATPESDRCSLGREGWIQEVLKAVIGHLVAKQRVEEVVSSMACREWCVSGNEL